jgi:hypothetical protein
LIRQFSVCLGILLGIGGHRAGIPGSQEGPVDPGCVEQKGIQFWVRLINSQA